MESQNTYFLRLTQHDLSNYLQDRRLCTGTVQLSDVIDVFFPEFGTAFLQGNTGKVKVEVTLTRVDVCLFFISVLLYYTL